MRLQACTHADIGKQKCVYIAVGIPKPSNLKPHSCIAKAVEQLFSYIFLEWFHYYDKSMEVFQMVIRQSHANQIQ